MSVSRSVFPIMTDVDRQLFIREAHGRDQIGVIDGFRSTFGKSYAGEPDQLVEALLADETVMSADTLMLTIPSQLGVDYNLHLLSAFAEHVAPELGWRPAPRARRPVTRRTRFPGSRAPFPRSCAPVPLTHLQ